MSIPRKDRTTYRIEDKGHLFVPRQLLAAAGLDPKMRVYIDVEGKRLVIEKAADVENPLDGSIGRKLDKDLFGKIHEEQQRKKEQLLGDFGKRVEDAASDPEPPDHPFRD